MIVFKKPSFRHFCCEMTGTNKTPLTYLYLHQLNLETNSNNENTISKTPFVECIWQIPWTDMTAKLIYSHIQICFSKKPFSRFAVSLERLGERPWVTKRPWKTLLALKDLESQKICERTEEPTKRSSDRKNNSKQTNCIIGKYFLAFRIKSFAIGI